MKWDSIPDHAEMLDLFVSPVGFVHAAHRANSQVDLRDGILTVAHEVDVMKIDTITGRLLELGSTKKNEWGGSISTVPHDPERFDKLLVDITREPNRFDSTRPVRSSLRFAVDLIDAHLTDSYEPPATIRERLDRLIDSEWLAEVDQDFANRTGANCDARKHERLLSFGLPKSNYAVVIPYLDMPVSVADLADALFERETWPWTITREFTFWYAQMYDDVTRRQVGREEFARIAARDDTGPLCFWTVASATGDSPFSKWMASRGLKKLDDGSIEREIAMLTAPDAGVMKMVKHVAPLAQTLEEEEIVWLAGLAGEDYSKRLEWLLQTLRAIDDPTPEAMRAQLTKAWDDGLRDRVEEDLLRLSGRTTLAEQPDQQKVR